MKIYSTKYALTKGIIEHDVTSADVRFSGLVIIRKNGVYNESLYGDGKQWHRSKSAAAARAEALAVKKIASLKNQIARLESFAEDMRSIEL